MGSFVDQKLMMYRERLQYVNKTMDVIPEDRQKGNRKSWKTVEKKTRRVHLRAKYHFCIKISEQICGFFA